MVSKKRLDYGFNGFRAPIVPRAPRSIRRRGSRKKLVEDSQLCAFELLAAVAGKLLQESESSAVADGKLNLGISGDENDNGQPEDDKALKSESYDHGSCAGSALVPGISVEEQNLLSNFKGIPRVENDSVFENTCAHASSDCLKKVDCDIKLGMCQENNADGITTSKVGGPVCIGGSSHEVGIGPEMQLEDDKNQIGDLSTAKTSTVKDPVGECVNTNLLINSESSVQLPLYRDPISLRKHWTNVKLGIRDDDENSFGCNKFSTRVRPLRPQPRVGNRRIRKMLASKYRKAAPKLKDCELYKTSDGMNTYYRYRKGIYTREGCQQAPLKKRKLSDHSFVNPYDQDAISDSISNFPDKGTKGANGTSGTVQGHKRTKDPHVKFSIKSFRVPELYIETPETATVGSLKRTVMEAVTAILGGGIRVGIALQGKKIRDDSRTLQQTGISESSTLDTLGFMLEPSFTLASPSKTPVKHPLLMPCDVNQQFERSPATPVIDSKISNAPIDTPAITKLDDAFDTNEFVSSTPSDAPVDGPAVSDSQALILAPPMNVDALSVVPVNLKPKRSELSQRRTRRPFSVGEVEALVESVEKLGTGRWRDVKMRAFENADHRTYVDLKDKWKTLVHTASIAPQQRRGEPVPQELLNRVLSAHSYWTQNQPKQHHSVEPLKSADPAEEVVGG